MFSSTDFGQSPFVKQGPAARMILTEIHACERAESTAAKEAGEGRGTECGLQERGILDR